MGREMRLERTCQGTAREGALKEQADLLFNSLQALRQYHLSHGTGQHARTRGRHRYTDCQCRPKRHIFGIREAGERLHATHELILKLAPHFLFLKP